MFFYGNINEKNLTETCMRQWKNQQVLTATKICKVGKQKCKLSDIHEEPSESQSYLRKITRENL
jgi:hypothetical protein